MDIEKIIKDAFYEAIKEAEIPSDLKNAVKSHERKGQFLINIRRQLDKVRADRLAKGKIPLSEDMIKWAAGDMTKLFIETVKKYGDHKVKSAAEKTRIKTEADEIADMESTLAGKPQGDYADIVKVVGDGDVADKIDADGNVIEDE